MAPAALHPPDDSLAAFGLGLLDDPAAADVARHLTGCAPCRRRVAELPADPFLGRLRDAVGPRADTSRPEESVPDAAPAPMAPAAVPPELAGAHYADVRELGRGGMGVVYLARNTIMDRLEVLKVVNRSPDRFVREIQAAARLKHPNVVGAYSAQRFGNLLVFAMEYVPGEDLSRLVKSRGPLPVRHACNYVCQAALGLQHAHEHGMVHRDIKPSNLILAREGNKPVVKILDFGLAKATGEKADGALTAEGAMLGTPDYIAPEQTLDAASADIRADIYSLGCTLYHLLAGRAPFAGRSMYETLRAHHDTEAPPLGSVRTQVPAELAAVVAKMMAKDPAGRFQTPAEVAAALTPFFKPGGKKATPAASMSSARPVMGKLEPAPNRVAPARPPDSTPPARPSRRRRPVVAAFATLGLVALLIGLAAAGVFRVKTPDGTIVLEGLPADAEVLVDDRTATVTRNGDEATITVARGGPYGLKVRVGDRELRTSDAEVTIGGQPVRVRVEGRPPGPVAIPPAADPGSSKPATAGPRPEGKVASRDRTARTNDVGQWLVKGDELIQSDGVTDNCVLVFGDPGWTDYDYTFDVVKTGGAFGVGAVFRARDPKNYVLFDLAGWQNRKYTVEVRADGEFHHWVNQDRAGSMASDRTYRVAVRARGDHFVCSIDGEVIYDVRDTHLARGAVGLRCWGGAVRVGSILVKSPDGAVLWQGPPDLAPPAADPRARRAHDNFVGRWRVDGDELVQESASGYTHLTFGDFNWSDYDFTCDAKRTGGGHEVYLRYGVTLGGYEVFGLGGWNNKDDFATSVPLGKPVSRRRAKSAGVPADQWIGMHVKVRGRRCECYRDGQLLFRYDNLENRKGAVGLGTNATTARFRNIRVTDTAGKLLWAGPPDLSGVAQAPPLDPKVRAAFTNRGDWRIEGTEMVQGTDRQGDCQIVFGDPTWTDYDFACEGKVIRGRGEIGQTFRVTEAGRYEWVRGRWTSDCDSLGSITNAVPPLERVRWRKIEKLEPDRWYKLEVHVRGPSIECFADGDSVFKAEHDVHKDGRVGLRTFSTEGRFRNLRVTDPAGNVLFEGLPELPSKKVDWILDS